MSSLESLVSENQGKVYCFSNKNTESCLKVNISR